MWHFGILFTKKWNSIREEIDHMLGNWGENHSRPSRHKWIRWIAFQFLSLSEIIELYSFYPELISMEFNNATARHFFISGAGPLTLLFAKFTEDRMIHKASRLWNFGWVIFSNCFSLISCITVIFVNRSPLETSIFYLLLFLIYMNTSGNFPFRQCRVR